MLRRLGYRNAFLDGVAACRDAFSRAKVEAGHALAEAYPLSESLRAEYEAARAREPR